MFTNYRDVRVPAIVQGEVFTPVSFDDSTVIVNWNGVFVKAEANYVEFVSESGTVMILMSMKRLEEMLPAEFLRVHRSYIVNRQHIARVEDGAVHVGKHHIPVSETYRDELRRKLVVIQ